MDNRKRRCGTGRAWILCMLVMSVGGCDRPHPAEELESAVASFAAGNYEEAALRLNYVMQLEPDNIRARELRGEIALLLGDYASAVADFVHARELGAPLESIALELAEALVGHGQIDEALELLDEVEPVLGDDPLYWILRAEALLAANRLSAAERSLENVRHDGDNAARVLTVRARISFIRGDSAEAFELIEQALAIAPDDPRVHIANAEMLARSDRLTEAAAELRRSADLYREASIGPRETLSLLGLAQVHIARNDLEAAEAVAARLAEQAPQMQSTYYFQGLVKFRRGQFDEAAALVQPLVNTSPETIQYRTLLGAIQLARGNLGQAEQQFLRVLAISPRDPAAAKLLAETRLHQQRPDAALDALLAVQDMAAEDPQIGLLSGIATVLAGDAEQGLLYLQQAAALDPTNEVLKLQLARAYLAAGRDEEASQLLTGSFGDDAYAIEASLLRLFAESRRGAAGSAEDIAGNLVSDYPDDPRVLVAVAVYYQLSGDTGRARELFERASRFDTDDATPQLFVAASLVQEGREDEAEQLLRQTIVERPENAQAIAGLAQLLASRGEFDEAAPLFERAAEHTNSVIPRLALVQMRLRQGNVAEARRELEAASVQAADNPEFTALSGIVALAEGQPREAVVLLEQAAPLLPDRLGVTVALARAQLADGQPEAARDTLLRILEVAPRSFPILLALGDAELQSGNAKGALAVATDLKVAFPSQAGGYLLEGKALLATQQYAAASKSLGMAFDRRPAWPTLALKIHALRLAGRPDEALEATDAWVTDNPDSIPAELMRAVLLQAAGRREEALAAYKSVLNVEAESVVALNNAAWVSHELGDPEALSLAERAYAVAPESAAVLDTLGWILLSRGEIELAIERLSRAVDLAPRVPEIRYHLAEALVAGGRSDSAREVLATLLAEVRDFEQRPEAQRLLESIKAEVP